MLAFASNLTDQGVMPALRMATTAITLDQRTSLWVVFNTGSPYNVVAGQGPRDMDALIAHYEKRNAEDDERKLKALADNSRS
ncbi:hypothetical protein DH86_00003636 [Scytalidium sp. 3C]|nr:hypothetical protein DH86_00003636 [Scytalidium sp. 3C]